MKPPGGSSSFPSHSIHNAFLEALEPEYLALLAKKYSALRIDVVVTVSQAALEFFKRHGERLWPGAWVVCKGFVGESVGPAALPLTQHLARLAIDAGRIERDAGGDASEMRRDLVRLSEDVHAMSCRLHPSVLDDLGLVEALRAECDRVAHHGEVQVEVNARDMPDAVPAEASLCLFRVAQEALNNATRHGRASAVTVLLSPRDRGLQFAVNDNGSGFDPEQPREHTSLGLASMRERVRVLRGQLDIESTPGRGTAVAAWVPA